MIQEIKHMDLKEVSLLNDGSYGVGGLIISSAKLKWISLSRKARRHNRKPKTHFKK